MGGQPRYDVRDLLIAQNMRLRTVGMSAPIWHSLVRLPRDDDASQALIAYERKIRWIDQWASFGRASRQTHRCDLSFISMTTGAVCAIRGIASRRVAVRSTCVRGGSLAGQRTWITPGRNHALREDVNLPIGQHTAGGFAEARHHRSRNSGSGDSLDVGNRCRGKINRVGKRDRRAILPMVTVASGAIRSVQGSEICHTFRICNL